MKRPVLNRVRIIEMIIADPPKNIRAFARMVGCSEQVITTIIRRLETEGTIPPRRYDKQFLWEQALEEVLSKRSTQ